MTASAENSPQAVMQAAAKEERWLKIPAGEIKVPDAPVMPDQKRQHITNGREGRRVRPRP